MNEHLNTFTGAQTSEQQRREMNLGDIAFDSDEEEEESEQPAAPATAVVAALQQGAAEVVEHNAQVGPRMTPGERKFVVRGFQPSFFAPFRSVLGADYSV